MNKSPYPLNTSYWRRDQTVLHYDDEKHPRMFMRVVGYTRDGLCKTQYVDRTRRRTILKNDLKWLLSPALFNLVGDENAEEFERVRLWNFYHRIGTPVCVPLLTGQVETKTRSEAWLAGRQHALVLVEGIVGGCYISSIEVARSGVPANE